MIITIISSDKITLSMFSDYFKTLYSTNTVPIIKDLTSLFSTNYQVSLFKDLSSSLNKDESLILKYKTKKTSKRNLPQEIFNGSDYVVYIDLFSTKPEVLKALDPEWIKMVLSRWETNIEKLSK